MSKDKSNFPFFVIGVSVLLGFLFLVFFYLAISNEPEYMPSKQQKKSVADHH